MTILQVIGNANTSSFDIIVYLVDGEIPKPGENLVVLPNKPSVENGKYKWYQSKPIQSFSISLIKCEFEQAVRGEVYGRIHGRKAITTPDIKPGYIIVNYDMVGNLEKYSNKIINAYFIKSPIKMETYTEHTK